MFFVTAGHCTHGEAGIHAVQGEESGYNFFGGVVRNDHLKDGGADAMLVGPYAGVAALQTVKDRGRTVGHTYGWIPNADINVGAGVGKVGRTTGLTYGIVRFWSRWINNERIVCTDFRSDSGDSGGPVFVHWGTTLYAMGILVGLQRGSDDIMYSCFIPIEDILSGFGAYLPVFSAGSTTATRPGAKAPATPSAFPANLPYRAPSVRVPL